MKIIVKAAGGVTKFMPDGASKHSAEVNEDISVGELLDVLGVPRNGPSVILLNKVTANLDSKLNDGDIVHLLPMVVGG